MDEKPLFDLLNGRSIKRMPVWLMRQAGRYLPEYHELRRQVSGFLEFCLTPELAAEATLQPVRRFGVDGAIVFADILLVPYALGRAPEFGEGTKPMLEPVRGEQDFKGLRWEIGKISNVLKTLRLVRAAMPVETTLIGFAGGPWTIAAYMIDGGSQSGFLETLLRAEREPEFIVKFLDILHVATVDYLGRQVEAGAEVLQIFDSCAGLLQGAGFRKFVIDSTRRLVEAVKARHPGVSVIGFPRGAKPEDYEAYARDAGVDSVSVDQNISLSFAREVLQPLVLLQGNLDPALLVTGGDKMKRAVEEIMVTLGPLHIVNLGHGVLPETPPAHVAEFVEQVRAWRG